MVHQVLLLVEMVELAIMAVVVVVPARVELLVAVAGAVAHPTLLALLQIAVLAAGLVPAPQKIIILITQITQDSGVMAVLPQVTMVG